MNKEKLYLAGGLIAGAAAGALLGILLAPDKGSATREKIVEKGEDYFEDLKDKMGEMIKTAIRNATDMKENLSSCKCGENCACQGDHRAQSGKAGA
jgi:gas vesicle protein